MLATEVLKQETLMTSNIRPLVIGLPSLLVGVAALVAGCGGNDNAQPTTAQQACDALTG